jgi:hypothetical protein
MESILAITFLFGSPVVIVLIVFTSVILRNRQRYATIRLAVEKGMDISPLLAEEASKPLQPRQYVLRGLLWGLPGLLVGAAVTWAAVIHEIPPYFAMVGWIPAAVGAAYLIFYRLGFAQNGGSGDAEQPTTSLAPLQRD